ncbi:hypothetical protein V2A84_09325 [Yersinia sp. 2553 StPb PI]|uniref:hypothetical protein n=1 Tax=Yersinia sp. 2553 StPb PI TaxID=3117411 RepID=UPI003FA4ADE6
MAWYRSGTVTSVAGTNIITGTSTQWNNPIFGIASGQMIFVPGAGQVVIYEILAVDSDTKIRVTKNIASAITSSEYAIVTTVSNSMSDLARRTAVQLALYQGLLEDWQLITTGTGNVSIIAPDGSTVVIPSLTQISQDVSNKVSQQQLSAIGIGLPNQPTIENFDWQTFVYSSGANYLSNSGNWVNTPSGVVYGNYTIGMTVNYITGSNVSVTLRPNTVSNTNFKVYEVISSGIAGSRTFIVREIPTSANPIPITGGGHGATTLAGAQSALGIVADAFGASQVANTAWINATLQNGWSAASGGRAVYRKVLGIVFIHLNLVPGTATDGTVLFTLPDGYRPAFATSLLSFAASSSAPLPARVNIQPNGQVTITQTAATYGVTIMSSFTIQ